MSTSPDSRKRFRLCLIFIIVFTALGFVSLSSLNTAASIDAYIDVEKYKTHLKGYIPSISGSLGLGRGKDGIPCDSYVLLYYVSFNVVRDAVFGREEHEERRALAHDGLGVCVTADGP
jgi:hypothetical protein